MRRAVYTESGLVYAGDVRTLSRQWVDGGPVEIRLRYDRNGEIHETTLCGYDSEPMAAAAQADIQAFLSGLDPQP